MVGTIIYKVGTIICDIGTINMKFYLLKIWYPHGYHRITRILYQGRAEIEETLLNFNAEKKSNGKWLMGFSKWMSKMASFLSLKLTDISQLIIYFI